MSDSRKEAEKKMAKAIFISADCWLCVFDLLPPRQLGFGISMISHRFNFYVDEHFKTRKWALKPIRIRRKIGKNGKKGMKIAKYSDGKSLPIPKIQMPRKVIGFKSIRILYIDRNTIAFLHRFRPLFASSPINLAIKAYSVRILKLIVHNIWPMIVKNICGLKLSPGTFRRFRKFAPSFLNDFPSLRFVNLCAADFFIEFPADDSAAASDGQTLAKWLFTPLQNNVPKMLKCLLDMSHGNLASRIEAFKTAFANASSPANFIVVIWFPFPFSDFVPFDLINGFTHEQLTLKIKPNSHHFLFVRCPIVQNASKWAKWEEEAIGWRIDNQWNQIDIEIYGDDDLGEGLLNTTPGPSDQQQK